MMVHHRNRTASDRDWSADSSCLNEDPDLFFPIGQGLAGTAHMELAKQICSTCPVRGECLALALRVDAEYGVWGGTTPDERKRIRRRAGIAKQKRQLVASRGRNVHKVPEELRV